MSRKGGRGLHISKERGGYQEGGMKKERGADTPFCIMTQHNFISAVLLLEFEAFTVVVTLIRGGVPPFKIFVLQLFNDKFQNLLQLSLIKEPKNHF